MALQQRAIAAVLAGSFLSLSLAGCGSPAPTAESSAQSGIVAQSQRPAATSPELARRFADEFQRQTGTRPLVVGDQVRMTGADGEPVSYDFSQTPKTGFVTFRAGEFETKFKWSTKEQIGNDAVPAILVAIAVKMVWGGTKSFLIYYLKHPGDKFNKHDCVKAVLFGMVAEGLTAIPVVGGVLSSILWPIAWKWVDKWLDKNLPFNAATVLQMGMELQGEVASALQEAIDSSK